MTKFVWGTVAEVGPLRVTLDGDSEAIPFVPDSLIDPAELSLGDRVRCELGGRRVVIHGVAGAGAVPAGNIAHTARTTAPNGWLLADGSIVSRSAYARLFAAIGTTFGAGDGSTTFGLPSLKGRAIVGRDVLQTEFGTLGETGGAKAHSHPLSDAGRAAIYVTSDGTHMRRVTTDNWERTHKFVGSGLASDSGGGSVGAALVGFTDSASTLSPYVVLNAIIKT